MLIALTLMLVAALILVVLAAAAARRASRHGAVGGTGPGGVEQPGHSLADHGSGIVQRSHLT